MKCCKTRIRSKSGRSFLAELLSRSSSLPYPLLSFVYVFDSYMSPACKSAGTKGFPSPSHQHRRSPYDDDNDDGQQRDDKPVGAGNDKAEKTNAGLQCNSAIYDKLTAGWDATGPEQSKRREQTRQEYESDRQRSPVRQCRPDLIERLNRRSINGVISFTEDVRDIPIGLKMTYTAGLAANQCLGDMPIFKKIMFQPSYVGFQLSPHIPAVG